MIPGTGPYKLEDKNIKNQESFTFERREDYWAEDSPFNRYKFNFEKIKVSVVKDNDALQFEKFKKGEQDIFNVQRSRRWVEETDFKATEKGWIKKQRVFQKNQLVHLDITSICENGLLMIKEFVTHFAISIIEKK